MYSLELEYFINITIAFNLNHIYLFIDNTRIDYMNINKRVKVICDHFYRIRWKSI